MPALMPTPLARYRPADTAPEGWGGESTVTDHGALTGYHRCQMAVIKQIGFRRCGKVGTPPAVDPMTRARAAPSFWTFRFVRLGNSIVANKACGNVQSVPLQSRRGRIWLALVSQELGTRGLAYH